MPYWRLYYHFVWATKKRLPLITPEVEGTLFVARLKGSSSHHLNETLEDAFAWQDGYGVVSFGEKQLEWVVIYANNQKQQHIERTTVAKLEEITVDSNSPTPTVIWSL